MRLWRPRPKKISYAWHNPELERAALIAQGLDASAFVGGWVQNLNTQIGDAPPATPAAVNTFTTFQSIMPATWLPENFIPANTLKPSSVLRLRAQGTIGSAAGTATTIMSFYLNNSVQIAASASQTPGTSTANVWLFEMDIHMVTTGATGTGYGLGILLGINATAVTDIIVPAATPATFSINTTVANYIGIGASWNTSAAGNTYSVYNLTCEQLS